ncbi:MAG TPA: MmgE/PrpD family protein [Thermodesulfobacteriota bacterium]|nr:MmgE/PrpD family protein [Thermodesulfobacteriota bacterium]
MMKSSPLLNLSDFVSAIRLEELDPSLVSHARLVLLDTLGAVIAGSSRKEISKLFAELPTEGNGRAWASCLGRSERVSPLTAAMVNGIAGSSLEFEEGNSWAFGHPAIQIVPALIAECEGRKSSGRELLAGLIGGYESAVRVSRASSLRKGLHPTGTWGTVGAALGVGRVRGRTGDELRRIANLAASYAISPYVKNSFVGKNVASTFAGVTNYFGLLANLFFDCGIGADESSLQMTFSRFVSDRFQEEALDEELGKNYYITTNYFKPYPGCRFAHSPIDALKAILQARPLRAEEVKAIRVETFQAAAHCDTKAPPNPEAVRFSIPYLFAILFLFGNLTVETMERVSVEDPRLQALAEKVEVKAVARYEELRPRHNPTRVTIELKDGQELTHEVMNALGDPVAPLGEEDLSKKFISLASAAIGGDQAEAFWEKSFHLERMEDIGPLIGLLRPTGRMR